MYRTDDRGVTWRELPLPGLRLGWGGHIVSPRLTSRGELVVPAHTGTGPESVHIGPPALLLVVRPDLSMVELARWPEDILGGVALVDEDVLVSVFAHRRAEHDVVRVGTRSPGAFSSSLERLSGSVAVSGSGRSALLLRAKWDPSSGPFAAVESTLMLSQDGAKTWSTPRDVTSEGIDSVCATPAGFWTLSTPNLSARFHHWPR